MSSLAFGAGPVSARLTRTLALAAAATSFFRRHDDFAAGETQVDLLVANEINSPRWQANSLWKFAQKSRTLRQHLVDPCGVDKYIPLAGIVAINGVNQLSGNLPVKTASEIDKEVSISVGMFKG